MVITGLGLVSPLGAGVARVWKKLLAGECGIQKLESTAELDYSALPCQVIGTVPKGTEPGELNVRDHVSASDEREMSVDSILALAAADEALNDAHWLPHFQSEEDRDRTGVSYGTAGLWTPEDYVITHHLLANSKYRKVSPYFIPRVLVNMSAGHVSIRYRLQGPNQCVSTACTTGLHSVGDSACMIARGAADVMVAGASEVAPHPIIIAGFCRVKALSTKFNSEPKRASRPFDAQRDGFVPSEGAGVVVLEELEHAKRRNAKIYAEVLGYGMSGDAHHITAPSADGKGARSSMNRALADASIRPDEVGHVNAHATSTPLGDAIENNAIKSVFGEHAKNLLIYAPKGALGHLMGAAGAVETILTILSVSRGLVPPNLNLEEREPDFDLNYVTGAPAKWTERDGRRRIAVTNSFGFGGTNGSLCIGEFRESLTTSNLQDSPV